ncbi:MAG: hypothetical protein JWP87_4249 [Labilithrix sp.]|nr:hypothetical protein [Labilithrix sp.]
MLGLEAFRDRFATSPHDLSDYAREHTGPTSWSAHPDADALSTWALAEHDDPYCARTTDLLSSISPLDVPHITVRYQDAAQVVGHREAFVMASIDGRSTCEKLVDMIDLPPGDVLAILCSLCARGLVVLGQ